MSTPSESSNTLRRRPLVKVQDDLIAEADARCDSSVSSPMFTKEVKNDDGLNSGTPIVTSSLNSIRSAIGSIFYRSFILLIALSLLWVASVWVFLLCNHKDFISTILAVECTAPSTPSSAPPTTPTQPSPAPTTTPAQPYQYQDGCEYHQRVLAIAISLGVVWLIRLVGEFVMLYVERQTNEERVTAMIKKKDIVNTIRRSTIDMPAIITREWSTKLSSWHVARERANQAFNRLSGNPTLKRAIGFYILYFILAFSVLCIVLAIVPQSTKPVSSVGEGFSLFLNMFNPIGRGPIAIFLLIGAIIEIFLFFVGVILVRWPLPHAVTVNKETSKPEGTYSGVGQHSSNSFSSLDTQSLTESLLSNSPIPNTSSSPASRVPSTCLMIACHESAIFESRASSLRRVLAAALEVFPPEAIFVCDNGNERHPVDATMDICREESIKKNKNMNSKKYINYIYVPEGNKSFALYWCSEFYIPALAASGVVPDFEFAVMIDDDVPIPSTFRTPYEELRRDPSIKAVCYTICAAAESEYDDSQTLFNNNKNKNVDLEGEYISKRPDNIPGVRHSNNILIRFQDMEYKMSGFMKLLQSDCGSVMSCHGAISLWRRDILGEKILFYHDMVFHGEDLYMGIILHRLQQGYSIKACGTENIITFAPETFTSLWRQRSKSWDLCTHRKTLTLLKMFYYYWSKSHLILKPFLLLDAITAMQDWFRIPLFVSYVMIDNGWTLLVSVTAFSIILSYIQGILFNYLVLRSRPDLQLGWSVILLAPFYRNIIVMFRIYALLENVIIYSPWVRKSWTISERWSTHRSIPPTPAFNVNEWPYVDWMNVWQGGILDDDDNSNTNTNTFDSMSIDDDANLRRLSTCSNSRGKQLSADPSQPGILGCMDPIALLWVDNDLSCITTASDVFFTNSIKFILRSIMILKKLQLEFEFLNYKSLSRMMLELLTVFESCCDGLFEQGWSFLSDKIFQACELWNYDKTRMLLSNAENNMAIWNEETIVLLRRVIWDLSQTGQPSRRGRFVQLKTMIDKIIVALEKAKSISSLMLPRFV